MCCAYWCTMYLYNILRGSIDCAFHWENWRFACMGPWLMRPSKYQRWHSYIFKISLRLIRLETPTNAISCLTFHIRHSFFLRLLRRFCCPPPGHWTGRQPTTPYMEIALSDGRNADTPRGGRCRTKRFFFLSKHNSRRQLSEALLRDVEPGEFVKHETPGKDQIVSKRSHFGAKGCRYIYIYAVYIYMAYFVNMLSKYQ